MDIVGSARRFPAFNSDSRDESLSGIHVLGINQYPICGCIATLRDCLYVGARLWLYMRLNRNGAGPVKVTASQLALLLVSRQYANAV